MQVMTEKGQKTDIGLIGIDKSIRKHVFDDLVNFEQLIKIRRGGFRLSNNRNTLKKSEDTPNGR